MIVGEEAEATVGFAVIRQDEWLIDMFEVVELGYLRRGESADELQREMEEAANIRNSQSERADGRFRVVRMVEV